MVNWNYITKIPIVLYGIWHWIAVIIRSRNLNVKKINYNIGIQETNARGKQIDFKFHRYSHDSRVSLAREIFYITYTFYITWKLLLIIMEIHPRATVNTEETATLCEHEARRGGRQRLGVLPSRPFSFPRIRLSRSLFAPKRYIISGTVMEIARFVTLNAVQRQRTGFANEERGCVEERTGDQRSFPESQARGRDERMITGLFSGIRGLDITRTVSAGETARGMGNGNVHCVTLYNAL